MLATRPVLPAERSIKESISTPHLEDLKEEHNVESNTKSKQ